MINYKEDQQDIHNQDNDNGVMVTVLQFLKMESYIHKIQNVKTQLQVSQEHLHELRSTVTVSDCPMSSGCGGDEQNEKAPIMDDEFISSSSSISISDASEDSITVTATTPTTTTKHTLAPPSNVSDSTRQLQDRVMDLAIHTHTAIMNTSNIIIKIDDHDDGDGDEKKDNLFDLVSAVDQKQKQTSTSTSSRSNKKSSNKNKSVAEQHKTSHSLGRSWHGGMKSTRSKTNKNNNSKHAGGGDSLRASLHGMFMLGGGNRNKKKTNTHTTKTNNFGDSLRSSLHGIVGGSKSKYSTMGKRRGAGTGDSTTNNNPTSTRSSSLRSSLHGMLRGLQHNNHKEQGGRVVEVGVPFDSIPRMISTSVTSGDRASDDEEQGQQKQGYSRSPRQCTPSSSSRRNREMAAVLTLHMHM
jgi:hypothetical protein